MIEVHVELLLGKRVRDANGEVVGRLLSIRAEKTANEVFVTEYQLGAAALMHRMGIATAQLFGISPRRKPRVIPWQLMDLRDPEKPRLKVTLAQLEEGVPRV